MTTTASELAPARVRLTLSWDRLLQWGVFLLTGLLVLFPVWPILYQSVLDRPLYDPDRSFTLANFSRVLSDPVFWQVTGRTMLFSGLTTLLALAVGTLMAVLIVRTDMPGRGLFSSLIAIPYFVSPLVLAFGWTVVFGPQGVLTVLARSRLGLDWNLYSMGGMIVVAALYYMPFTFLACVASLRLADPQIEHAARIAGCGPVRTLVSITLPLLRPAIIYSALLIFVSSIELLSIPLVLGTPARISLLATYVYQLGVAGITIDYGALAVVAIVLVLLITGLVLLQGRLVGLERRFVTVGAKAVRPQRLRLGVLRWPLAALVGMITILGIIAPLLGIFVQASTALLSPFINPLSVLTLKNFAIVFEQPAYRESIVNSLLVATLGGAVGIFFMALVALTTYRSDFRWRDGLRFLALYPRAFPALIMGIGFLWTYLLIPGIGGVRNTLIAITIAFIVTSLPMGFGTVSPSVLQISPELDRAARVAGSSWFGTLRHILLPMLRPALLSGYVLLFITFLKEYSVALFLFAPGSRVIGTTMIELWRQGNPGPVSALAAVQIVVIAVVVVISRRFFGVKLHE
ncbi:MAG: iron ABC transporter permease [Chloroflexi bacterium OHK40]